jgi:hypothetical protein
MYNELVFSYYFIRCKSKLVGYIQHQAQIQNLKVIFMSMMETLYVNQINVACVNNK